VLRILLILALAGTAATCERAADESLAAVSGSCLAWAHDSELRWIRVNGTTATRVSSARLPQPVSLLAAVKIGEGRAVAVAGGDHIYVLSQYGAKPRNDISVAPGIVRDICAYDLDGDGWDELLVLVGERRSRRGTLGVYSTRQRRWLWRGLNPDFSPWRVRVGDLEGDGRPSVVIGVWKKARFDPVFDNRVFVYHWAEGELRPSWLGSRLGPRFSDFELADMDGDGRDEIVTVSRRKGGCSLQCFGRYGFGFSGESARQIRFSIRSIAAMGHPATLFALECAHGWQVCKYRQTKQALRAVEVVTLRRPPEALCALDTKRIAYTDGGDLRVLRGTVGLKRRASPGGALKVTRGGS
jgi:hypothetical protein